MRVVVEGGAPIKMWEPETLPFDQNVMDQARNTASLPFIFKHVALMADAHLGIGATVGSVVPTIGAIVPACVGVDLSCGMIAQRLNLIASDLPDNLDAMRDVIEQRVPHGTPHRGNGSYDAAPMRAEEAYQRVLADTWKSIDTKHPKIGVRNCVQQLGTLGGGNHFIEVCLDESDRVWVMLHSGSRGVGNRIGTYFIELAREDMRTHHINLPDRDLAYLSEGTQYFDDYVQAFEWAGKYALLNRTIMVESTLEAMRDALKRSITYSVHEPAVSCHHNYVSREEHYGRDVWITRKGAVSARAGEYGIIPGAMGKKSYIVEGLGNPESFMSCSHGAGRVMSRSKAKATFTLEDHAKATEGVSCRKDAGVLDETPHAYKDLDKVMEAQRDLVKVVATLRAVLTVKG